MVTGMKLIGRKICACERLVRLGAGVVLFLVALSNAACGELEPMAEPEVVDLQLSIDTLKTQVRDTQRTITELRAELDVRRQELADAQVARAQLEGRVREAERRVAEAKQVIELQREELMTARAERERLSRSSLQLHSQLKRLQKHLSKSGMSKDGIQDVLPAFREGSGRKAQKTAMVATPAALMGTSVDYDDMASDRDFSYGEPAPRTVFVKYGDTLWSLAKRHHVSLHQLREINQLSGNAIEIGQALRLPEGRRGRASVPGVPESIP
ncbi:conserved protein of unknown function [Nitrospira japonica]|uniref:LysM domain-containing protein n=2 Tax=Nitrospira japonica TaxID=1325564 RepID=A0A1W1IB15_9BACT|nr:conserved protein of unknown function [Nitrospira japonica]